MPELSEAQVALVDLIESAVQEEIDGIGEPKLEDEIINVGFQYGEEVYAAAVDVESGTLSY